MPSGQVPFRPADSIWRGVVLKSGDTVIRPGELLEAFNCFVSRGDLIEKRRGFIRGFPDAYNGPVVGLPWTRDPSVGKSYFLVDAGPTAAGVYAIAGFVPPAPPNLFPPPDGYPNDDYNRANVAFSAATDDKWIQVQTGFLGTFGIETNRAKFVNGAITSAQTSFGGKAWFKPAPIPYHFFEIKGIQIGNNAIAFAEPSFDFFHLRTSALANDSFHSIPDPGSNTASFYEFLMTHGRATGPSTGFLSLSIQKKRPGLLNVNVGTGQNIAVPAFGATNFRLRGERSFLTATTTRLRLQLFDDGAGGATLVDITNDDISNILPETQRDNLIVTSARGGTLAGFAALSAGVVTQFWDDVSANEV